MTGDRTGSCQWIGTIDDTMCGAAPVRIVVTGCVHEHIGEAGMCARHFEQVGGRMVNCLHCWDSHRCPKVLITSRPVPVGAA